MVLLIFCTLTSFSLFFQVSSFVLVIRSLFWKFSLSVWLLGLQQEVFSGSDNTLSLHFSSSSSLWTPLLLTKFSLYSFYCHLSNLSTYFLTGLSGFLVSSLCPSSHSSQYINVQKVFFLNSYPECINLKWAFSLIR